MVAVTAAEEAAAAAAEVAVERRVAAAAALVPRLPEGAVHRDSSIPAACSTLPIVQSNLAGHLQVKKKKTKTKINASVKINDWFRHG